MRKPTSNQCQRKTEVSHIVWFNCDHESENNIFADVISKFRFSMPSDQENCSLALHHDNENDIVVRRKMNEFIEIGNITQFWITFKF